MSASRLAERIQYKMFVGALIRPEIRMHLDYSPSWKQTQALQAHDADLSILELQGKQYIGLLIPTDKISLPELKSHQHRLNERLRVHCPDLNTDNTELYVIPQMFIS